MRLETLVLDVLENKMGRFFSNNEEFLSGLQEYIYDNNFRVLIKDSLPEEKKVLLIEMFMEPFFHMAADAVNAYFLNYVLVKDFKMVSNTIFSLALKKYQGADITELDSAVEVRAMECIASIYADKDLNHVMATEVSDVLLDLDYVKDKSDRLSFRLSREVKKL